jgi:hypothetical protein
MLGALGIEPGALLALGGLGAVLTWLLSGKPRKRAAIRARKRG